METMTFNPEAILKSPAPTLDSNSAPFSHSNQDEKNAEDTRGTKNEEEVAALSTGEFTDTLQSDAEIEYSSGLKLASIVLVLRLAVFCVALDGAFHDSQCSDARPVDYSLLQIPLWRLLYSA